MAKVSFIVDAIALITGNVLCQTDATYGKSHSVITHIEELLTNILYSRNST